MIQPFKPQTAPFPTEWNEYFTRLHESLFPVYHQFNPNMTGVTGSATGTMVTMGLWALVTIRISSGNSTGGNLMLPFTCSVASIFTVLGNGIFSPITCPAKSNVIPLPTWVGESVIINGIGIQ